MKNSRNNLNSLSRGMSLAVASLGLSVTALGGMGTPRPVPSDTHPPAVSTAPMGSATHVTPIELIPPASSIGSLATLVAIVQSCL